MTISSVLQTMVTRKNSTDLTLTGKSKFALHFILQVFVLVSLSAVAVYAGFKASLLSASLLSAKDESLSFNLITRSDGDSGYTTISNANLFREGMTFSYNLGDDAPFSYAIAELSFASIEAVDLSKYSKVALNLQCEPSTSLHFSITTAAENQSSSSIDDRLKRPLLEKQFTCGEASQSVEIPFDTLNVPVWWLNFHDYEFAKSDHDLSQVVSLAIGTTRNTQKHVKHQIVISSISLSGKNWKNLYISFFAIGALWFAWLTYRLKQYPVNTQRNIYEEPAQGAKSFQALADKQVSSLMSYIGNEFDNPDLSMDMIVSKLGMNKNKINSILKDEVGLTFSAYINQMRLTKSANLLSSNPNVSVAEAAFAVGYNNPSYYSKLFKQQFGCSPKAYKPEFKINKSDN